MLFHSFPDNEEKTALAGYSALINEYGLKVPNPDYFYAISTKHRKYSKGIWRFLTPRHKPENNLRGHLIFALKNEGVDLLVLKSLFKALEPTKVIEIVQNTPTGSYSRRIWFLYEWLLSEKLDIKDATHGNFISVIEEKIQFPGPSRVSRRHRVKNNLPGTQKFCPLIRKTDKLNRFISANLSQEAINNVGKIYGDLLSRAASFLLLKDSKASFTIEGESPSHNRVERWGRVIGEAGKKRLTLDELARLQEIIIPDTRFVNHGLRTEGGFVGEHDRETGMPLPIHISARSSDLGNLILGLLETYRLLCDNLFNPVLTATVIAFGFVFIHPFVDGNGRIHRYLLHHILAECDFVPKGLVFPVSANILSRVDVYRRVLEQFSKPRLDLIKWRPTDDNNVEVLNDTADFYCYFDATHQAEFLFECVAETVSKTLPEEVEYLRKHDLFTEFMKSYLDMNDKLINLLIRFLHGSHGNLSKCAREKEFKKLTTKEIAAIENKYKEVFMNG